MFKLLKSALGKRQNIPSIETNQEEPVSGMTRQEEVRFIELMSYVNKPVILISNEWEDLEVGFGVGVEYITNNNTPVLVVRSYITGEEFITFSKVFHYTTQRFNALMQLDPFERWCLIQDHDESFNKPRKQPILSSKKDILDKLRLNGFFMRIGKESPTGNCSLRNLTKNALAIRVPDKVALGLIPNKGKLFSVYLISKELENTFVNTNPDFTESSCFENAITKEAGSVLTIIFFVDDFNEQREIIEVLNDVILENHHYDKREIKTLWNQSEHLWRNRYSVDDQVAQPEIGWGTIKVMFNL